MIQTKTYPGYGVAPSFMGGGDLSMGQEQSGPGMPAPQPEVQTPAPDGGLAELQPMVEAYVSNPDPALAEEIIMNLANSMGIAPPAPAQAPPVSGGGDPMGGGGAPSQPQFKEGGKISSYLKTLKLN